TLGALRDAQHAGVVGADFHLQLLVALRDLLGGGSVHDLVAHADQPHAAGFVGLHAAHRAARGVAARAAAQHAHQAADRAAVEALLVLGDLFGLEDVELDDPLGRPELAHAHGLA